MCVTLDCLGDGWKAKWIQNGAARILTEFHLVKITLTLKLLLAASWVLEQFKMLVIKTCTVIAVA